MISVVFCRNRCNTSSLKVEFRMSRKLLFLIFISSGILPLFAGRELPSGPSEPVVADELLVSLRPGASASVISAIAPAAVLNRLNKVANIYHLRLPAGLQRLITTRLAADSQ